MDKGFKKSKKTYNYNITKAPIQINNNDNFYKNEDNLQELPLVNSTYYTKNIIQLSPFTELENRLNIVNYKITNNDIKSEAILKHLEHLMKNPKFHNYYSKNNYFGCSNENIYDDYNNEQTKRWRKKIEKKLLKEKIKAKVHFNEQDIPFFYSMEKKKYQEQFNCNLTSDKEYNKQLIKQPKQLQVDFKIPQNLQGILERDKIRTFKTLTLIEEECNQIKSDLKRNLNLVEMQNKLNTKKLKELQQKQNYTKKMQQKFNNEQESEFIKTLNKEDKLQIQLPTLRLGTELITKIVNGRKQIILGRNIKPYSLT